MKLVVFDMDGTLINSAGFITGTVQAVWDDFGLPPISATEAGHIIGLSLDVALSRLSGFEGAELDRLVDAYRTKFRERLNDEACQEPLFDGAIDVLQSLHQRPDFLLAIATGKGLSGVDRILDKHGIADLFVSKQTPDHNPSKPHPGMLLRAMDETGVAAVDCVMIGDTSYDMDMAKAAKTGALGVSWGSHSVEILADCGAHVVIDRYAHMLDAIDDILETRRHLLHA